MSRPAPPIMRLARLVAGEAAPKARVRVVPFTRSQDSASSLFFTRTSQYRRVRLRPAGFLITMKKKNIGSSVDSWLREEGIYEKVTAAASMRVLARQIEAAMKEKNVSKAEMARRMSTSRAALDRLLDPDYNAVTLSTLRKAATALGRELRLELV